MAVIADALVSKLVDVLVSTISDEIRRVAGVEEEVEKLTASLRSIQAVITDAERRQWKEETVQLWLDRLKNVAYDIDDALDAWSYEILKSRTGREENAGKPTSKVRSLNLWSACHCFPKAVSRHHMAIKISDLNARLDVIANEKDRYNLQLLGGSIDRNIEHNTTTSVIDISEVRGRDADKENLVSMLLSGDSEQKAVRVISIVGMGGIGKTTLARLVYNDERVKSHFQKRIWVCVSEPFDETRVARDILESLVGYKPNVDALPNIMKEIQELVGGEECFFVLDDVWNENFRKWEQLKSCLKCSASKSRILVTTRKEEVGQIMGSLKSDIVRVGELSKEASWELFCMIAFYGRSGVERASLEEIGRKVVERCKGLPLAIKSIASLLQLKEGTREWQEVLDSELWNQDEFQRDIAPALWLSYYDLPSHLKQCFAYCAIFPKDYEMENYELINHWIALGYIKETRSRDMVTVGEEYFRNLLMRSFFQDAKVSIFSTRCKLHDIVHDFAKLLVKKECHSIEVNDENEEISFNNDSLAHSLHHLHIRFQNKVKCLDSFYNLKNLHSLIVSSSEPMPESISFGLDLQKLFSVSTLLRSLKLSNCGIEVIPSNIKGLIHLRELDLSYNDRLLELPDTVWELYNLQILNLEFTGIKSIKGIERLISLRYLDHGIECFLPKEVASLSGLRRLSEINLGVNNEAFSLEHLKNFNQLVGMLQIRWFNRDDGDVEDAKQAQLMGKKNITRLWLDFGWEREVDERRKKQDEELVEALNAPPNLEFLRINYYMGLRTPNWLHSLSGLKLVDLIGWMNYEHLPPLGKLPCLEDLQFHKFDKVVKVGAEFLGIDEMMKSTTVTIYFPKLKSLKFSSIDNWEEWNDVDGDKDEEILIMPSLTTLEIDVCPKLMALPNFILKKTSLKLHIKYCDALEQSTSLGELANVIIEPVVFDEN